MILTELNFTLLSSLLFTPSSLSSCHLTRVSMCSSKRQTTIYIYIYCRLLDSMLNVERRLNARRRRGLFPAHSHSTPIGVISSICLSLSLSLIFLYTCDSSFLYCYCLISSHLFTYLKISISFYSLSLSFYL